MIRRVFRKGLWASLLGGVGLALAKVFAARRSSDAEVSSDPWTPLPPVSPPPAPLPTASDDPAERRPPEPVAASPPPAAPATDDHAELVDEVTHAVDEPGPEGPPRNRSPRRPGPRPVSARPTPPVSDDGAGTVPPADQGPRAWVAPTGAGTCPADHPVKAKLGSRIFHLPGMLNYERTKADRCYPTAEAAEADGLRRSKR